MCRKSWHSRQWRGGLEFASSRRLQSLSPRFRGARSRQRCVPPQLGTAYPTPRHARPRFEMMNFGYSARALKTLPVRSRVASHLGHRGDARRHMRSVIEVTPTTPETGLGRSPGSHAPETRKMCTPPLAKIRNTDQVS